LLFAGQEVHIAKNCVQGSAPSCQHSKLKNNFGHHGEWKIGDLKIKRETYLKNYQSRTNVINSTSGSIICLSLSPLIVQKVEWVNLNELQLKMANLIDLKGFCPPLVVTQSQQLCNVEINRFCY